MNKPNIALVMGGYSGEHDISIQSGCQVYEALDHQKYTVFKVVKCFSIHFSTPLYCNLSGSVVPENSLSCIVCSCEQTDYIRS